MSCIHGYIPQTCPRCGKSAPDQPTLWAPELPRQDDDLATRAMMKVQDTMRRMPPAYIPPQP
jgi:hypothetical protein